MPRRVFGVTPRRVREKIRPFAGLAAVTVEEARGGIARFTKARRPRGPLAMELFRRTRPLGPAFEFPTGQQLRRAVARGEILRGFRPRKARKGGRRAR